MRGNNLQLVAEREQEARYQLSEDIAAVVPNCKPSVEWPPTLWAVLTFKYLHNPRQRATLGMLGLMAGYEVRANVRA